MDVIAIERGYHGSQREPGDRFIVPEGSKASWYVPADKADAAPVKPRRKPQSGPATLVDITKADGEALGAGLI